MCNTKAKQLWKLIADIELKNINYSKLLNNRENHGEWRYLAKSPYSRHLGTGGGKQRWLQHQTKGRL